MSKPAPALRLFGASNPGSLAGPRLTRSLIELNLDLDEQARL
jgi:hypothetical protein